MALEQHQVDYLLAVKVQINYKLTCFNVGNNSTTNNKASDLIF